MKYFTIEIGEDIWQYLQRFATPFIDTPDTILRKILFSESYSKSNVFQNSDKSIELPNIPGIKSKALEQILEMIYLVIKKELTRIEATKLIAKRRNIKFPTVFDKYCRQLGKNHEEIDLLLEPQNQKELKELLKNKFFNYRTEIDDFFLHIMKQ